MGMTYRLDTQSGYNLISEMVFDREWLGDFMGLSDEEYGMIDRNGKCLVNMKHINRAIHFLEDFNERMRRMPYDKESEAYKMLRTEEHDGNERIVLDENGNAVYDYVGSDDNIAILKEVEKVLCRTYHFLFPWEEGTTSENFGVTHYINALKSAKACMEKMNVSVAVLFWY